MEKYYKKTRYQNIYKHEKNKNYIITISKINSTISRFNGDKIYSIDIALKVRDSYTNKQLNKSNISFEELYNKYLYECEHVYKMAYNTLKKKKMFYNIEYHRLAKYKINQISKNDLILFFNSINRTTKEKNELLKMLKAFFTWCCKNEYLDISPALYITKEKTTKPILNYWLQDDINRFIKTLNNNLNDPSSRLIKILTISMLSLGCRLGELRALTFNDIDFNKKIITIRNSIEYDTSLNRLKGNSKNIIAQRDIFVTDKYLNEIFEYKKFLTNNIGIQIKKDTPLLLSVSTGKQISDVSLRKHFNHYIELAGVPKIRMYDLRHTFATLMMEQGIDMYVLEKSMGHSKISTTIDVYGNVSTNSRKKVSNITDDFY